MKIILKRQDLPKHRASELYMDARFRARIVKSKKTYTRKRKHKKQW